MMRKEMKKLLALLLVFAMVFSIAACGKDNGKKKSDEENKKTEDEQKDPENGKDADEDADKDADKEKDKEKDEKQDVTSFNDALGLLEGYKNGEYELTGSIHALDEYQSDPDRNFNLDFKLYGEQADMDCTMNLEFTGGLRDAKIDKKYDNIFTIKDGKLYFGLDSFIAAYSDKKADLGSFGLLLPELDQGKIGTIKSEGKDLLTGFFTAAVKDLDTDFKDGKVNIHFSGVEDLKKIYKSVADWLDENKTEVSELLEKVYKAGDSIDLDDYIVSLVDEYYDPVMKSLEILAKDGEKIGLDQIDIAKLLQELKEEKITKESAKKLIKEDFADDFKYYEEAPDAKTIEKDIEEMVADIRDGFKENETGWEEEIEFLNKTDLTISMEFGLKYLTVSVKGVIADADYECNVDLSYTFKKGSPEIKAPADVKTLDEIVQSAVDKADTLKEIFEEMCEEGNSLVFSSYKRYIDRSRISSDAYTLSNAMGCVPLFIDEDKEFAKSIGEGGELTVKVDKDGKITLATPGGRYDSLWLEAAGGTEDLQLKSDEFKKETTITGKYNAQDRKIYFTAKGDLVDFIGSDAFTGYARLKELASDSGYGVNWTYQNREKEADNEFAAANPDSSFFDKGEEISFENDAKVRVYYNSKVLEYFAKTDDEIRFRYNGSSRTNVTVQFISDCDFETVADSFLDYAGTNGIEAFDQALMREYPAVFCSDPFENGNAGYIIDFPEIDGVIILSFGDNIDFDDYYDLAGRIRQGCVLIEEGYHMEPQQVEGQASGSQG